MDEYIRRTSLLKLIDLLRGHDPATSDEQIAAVVSEWGHLLNGRIEKENDLAKIDVTASRHDDSKG
jgi:hypothetical protein